MFFDIFLAEYRRRTLIKEQAINNSAVANSANVDTGKLWYFFFSKQESGDNTNTPPT